VTRSYLWLLGVAERSSSSFYVSISEVVVGRLDDRCALLDPGQRRILEDYRQALESAATAHDPGFPSVTNTAVETDAAAIDCPQARVLVRDAYEDALAALSAAKTAPLTLAMNVGERCVALSDENKRDLMAAWRRDADEVARRFNARIRMKYVMYERAYDSEADLVPCSRARAVVQSALQGLRPRD